MSEYDRYDSTTKKEWNIVGGIHGLTEKEMQYLWTMIIAYVESHGGVAPLGFGPLAYDAEEDEEDDEKG